MRNKVWTDSESVLGDVLRDGMTIMAGGFGLCGIPENLIHAISRSGVRDLTLISNNCGVEDFGLGILLSNGQVRKMIASYVGENKLFERLYLEGRLELELNPQGTLAERIRAGGAGIGGFYTRTGVGTVVAEGKPTREFNGEIHLLETGLLADLAIVKAWKADREGNLVYRKTARNFNPMVATAGRITIAEAEVLLENGEIDGDHTHTPGIYVDRVIKSTINEKRIEKLTERKREAA